MVKHAHSYKKLCGHFQLIKNDLIINSRLISHTQQTEIHFIKYKEFGRFLKEISIKRVMKECLKSIQIVLLKKKRHNKSILKD